MVDVKPDISIIVPVYNTESFLPACLESIDAQGRGAYEVILVDDGSTDGSPKICDDYCKGNKKAFAIHKDNEGLLAARRDGLRRAKGRYVLALDSDDCLLAGCLKKVCSAITSSNADIISFDFTMKLDSVRPSLKACISPGIHVGGDFDAIRSMLCGCDFNSVWNKVIRTDLFPGYDWYTNRIGLMHGEDLCQLLPVFDKARSLFHIDEPLYYYRQHDSNSTKVFQEKQVADWGRVCDEMLQYAARWSKSAHLNARRGICQHYCDLDEILWRCDLDDEAKNTFDKMIKLEYRKRVSGFPDLVHSMVLSNNVIVSSTSRKALGVFKAIRRSSI